VSESEVFIGLALLLVLAVGCQIVATRVAVPSIILLLGAGFLAGALTESVDPNELMGDKFAPMVTLAVGVILFDGALDLRIRDLEGHGQHVVRRLILWGVPITWAGAVAFVFLLLDLSAGVTILLGAILIVSGPTVVIPLLERARPGRRVSAILRWECTTVDPIGAIIGALVFHALTSGEDEAVQRAVLDFTISVGIGILGGLVGTVVLWLLLDKLRVTGVLATEATIATVVAVTAVCDAVNDDTGLIAAIVMGLVVANTEMVSSPEDRPFFRTIVQLIIGLLFVSISATVTPESLGGVLWPSLALVGGLVLVVRPVLAALATIRTDLSRKERAYIGMMDPRGIVAASTAATFAGPLAATGEEGAADLLPVTFLVIVGTVTIYGLLATPAARALGLTEEADEHDAAVVQRPLGFEDPAV